MDSCIFSDKDIEANCQNQHEVLTKLLFDIILDELLKKI